MFFEIIGQIYDVETFAVGTAIREIARLQKFYGKGRWRKRKGIATLQIADGQMVLAEIHWYEATGIGKREIKIKRLLQNP